MSRTDLEAFRAVQAGLSREVQRQLSTVWRALDREDRARFVRILQGAVVDVVTGLGEVSAVAGADYYDTLRESRGVAGAYRAPVPPAAVEEQILASTRWALAQPDAFGNLMKAADRLVKLPGREAVRGAMAGDPADPRYARVPQGLVTCRFCAMLASRGAVYLTADTAAGHDYHDFCDCVPVVVFDDRLPEGYDPEHYEAIYRELGGASIDLSGSRDASVLTS